MRRFLLPVVLIVLGSLLIAWWAEMLFGEPSKQQALIAIELGSVAARLDRLEPCYHTFSWNDAQDLIACLRLHKSEQRHCLDEIQSHFKR